MKAAMVDREDDKGIESERLWHEFRDRLFAFVRRRVSSDAVAEDILQQSFLKMHQSIQEGVTPQDTNAWVFAITRNTIFDHLRSVRSHTNRQNRLRENSESAAAEGEEPGDRHVLEEMARCVEPLLGQLENSYREALTLTAMEGMSQSDAARKLGVSVSGMKSRVQRGRRKLRSLFEECCAIEVDSRNRPIDAEPFSACACQPEE